MNGKTVWTFAAFCAALALAGCGTGESGDARPETLAVLAPSSGPEESAGEDTVLTLKIVDGAQTGELLLAGQGAEEVYTLAAGEVPVYLDGKPADAGQLEDGMPVEISCGGQASDTWPAGLEEVRSLSGYSLGTEQNPGGGAYDLCGLYLRVLEDLWEADRASTGESAISVSISPGRPAA